MAATGHHPPASNPKRPCWFYGKISGCRYGNGCKYDHSISKTSIYGKLFGILDEILKNQNAIYKAIQQTQNIQFPYNSSTGDVKEEDIQPHQVPRRKIRSKRGKSPPLSDDDDNWMSSGAVSGTVNAQTTPQSTQNPSLSLPKQYPPKHHNTSVCEPARSPPKSTAITLSSECKDSHTAVTVAQNKIKKQQQQQQPRPPKSPPSYSPPRQPRQPRYPRQLPPNTKPIEHTNPQHPPRRSKAQCTASKVQKSKRNTTKHSMQHPRKLPPKTKQIKKKKSQTKKTLNPYARVFSKGELYDTCNKDTKCKDDPPPKARPHTRQNTDDITPQSKPKPSQYLASIGLHIQPKQPKNPQHNIPPKSLQKKAIPPSYSPPSHPQNTGKLKQPIYGPEVYWKHARNLITEDTDEDIKRIIIKYDEHCSTSPCGGVRVNTQLHPNSFMTFVMLETLIDGNYTEEHMDIDDYFEKRYPKHGIYVPPISSDTTFSQLINETFRKLDEANIKYNDTALFP
eukprot:1023757_1